MVAKPLTPTAEKAFNELKSHFTSAPTLCRPDPSRHHMDLDSHGGELDLGSRGEDLDSRGRDLDLYSRGGELDLDSRGEDLDFDSVAWM